MGAEWRNQADSEEWRQWQERKQDWDEKPALGTARTRARYEWRIEAGKI